MHLSFFFATFLIVKATDINGLTSSSQMWWGIRTPLVPRFLESPQNVSVISGETAFLPCSVQHLGERSITWMRQRDLHILTVDMFTYSADSRYKVIHYDNSDDWTLQIYQVALEDDGLYECQVNSDPKISRKIFLKVKENNQLDDPGPFVHNTDGDARRHIEEKKKEKKKKKKLGKKRKGPKVMIEGLAERHIEEGSLLSLTCVVRHPPKEAPEDIVWFRNDESLDFDSDRRGVFIKVENRNRRSISHLSISHITEKDSGEYICSPMQLPEASVIVHVQMVENQAAVYQSGLGGATPSTTISYLMAFVLLLPFGLTGG